MDILVARKIDSYTPLSILKNNSYKELTEALRDRENYLRNEGIDPISYKVIKREGYWYRYTISSNEYIKAISIIYKGANKKIVSKVNLKPKEGRTIPIELNGYISGYYLRNGNIILDFQKAEVLASINIQEDYLNDLIKTKNIVNWLPNMIYYTYMRKEDIDNPNDSILNELMIQLNVLSELGYWTWNSRNLLDETPRIINNDIVARKYLDIKRLFSKQ